ncbi:2TM domain-containing protein [Variovorax sp.]|uniref:2TM domain-containing protein n=1 Tax=Variovorax sp. TaxID=1871043 RepID=UPI002D6BA9B6|nr:2TM domain-containing protein [Variovorax sp.]HYP83986.1 2TM domain-containing protein [Variovorax sp.]
MKTSTRLYAQSRDPDTDLDRLARRRARAKMGWLLHATVFLAVNAFLVVLSLSTGRHWAIYPLLGWGLGLAIHAAAVWLLAPGGALLQRLVDQERSRLGQRDPW